jgi:hypothetical protein
MADLVTSGLEFGVFFTCVLLINAYVTEITMKTLQCFTQQCDNLRLHNKPTLSLSLSLSHLTPTSKGKGKVSVHAMKPLLMLTLDECR